jgi:hypothetical protein
MNVAATEAARRITALKKPTIMSADNLPSENNQQSPDLKSQED